MTARDDFLLLTSLPTAAGATPSPQTQAPAPSASPPSGAGAVPLTCAWTFCDEPATDGDFCAAHAEKTRDLRQEYFDLQAEFEDGWT